VANGIETDCIFLNFGLDSHSGEYFDLEPDQLAKTHFVRMLDINSAAFLAPTRESWGWIRSLSLSIGHIVFGKNSHIP
jgi:hypothetical protein